MTRPHRAHVAQNGTLGPENPKSVTSRSVTRRYLSLSPKKIRPSRKICHRKSDSQRKSVIESPGITVIPELQNRNENIFKGIAKGGVKNRNKGGCKRLLAFVHVCSRLLAFACVCASAFACVCQRLSAFVCVCLHLLTPPFVAPPSA